MCRREQLSSRGSFSRGIISYDKGDTFARGEIVPPVQIDPDRYAISKGGPHIFHNTGANPVAHEVDSALYSPDGWREMSSSLTAKVTFGFCGMTWPPTADVWQCHLTLDIRGRP